MKNYEILESLCYKLKSWGIDPRTLAKAIGIFLVVVIIVVIMVMYPVLLVTLLCLLLIVLIYTIIE